MRRAAREESRQGGNPLGRRDAREENRQGGKQRRTRTTTGAQTRHFLHHQP
jgi:hypothetical protein